MLTKSKPQHKIADAKSSLQDVLFRMAYKGARQFGDTEHLESLKRIYPERFAECEFRYNRGTL